MMSWKTKLQYILEEADGIHAWYSLELGWCFLTDRRGERHRLDDSMSFDQIKNAVDYITKVHSYGTYTIQKHYR